MSVAALSLDRTAVTVARAREFVTGALRDRGMAAQAPDAALATSELITNALVHTTGRVELRISGSAERLRIEVRDESPVLPSPGLLDRTAMSGRGLLLVSRLSAAWGWQPVDGGKVVWFELAPGVDGVADDLTAADLIAFWSHEDELGIGPAPAVPGPAEPVHAVRIPRLPTALLLAVKAHGEDLMREAALVLAQPEGRDSRLVEVAARLHRSRHPMAAISAAIRSQALAAAARRQPTLDLELRLTAGEAETVESYLAALEDADELAGLGLLLGPPPRPEVAALRRAYLVAIAAQARTATAPAARYLTAG